MQNEHPACIYYDFEVDWEWKPLIPNEHLKELVPIDKDVVIGPALRQHQCDVFADGLVQEMLESIRMYRAKIGLDTNFDHNDELMKFMRDQIKILEDKSQIDPDFCEVDA